MLASRFMKLLNNNQNVQHFQIYIYKLVLSIIAIQPPSPPPSRSNSINQNLPLNEDITQRKPHYTRVRIKSSCSTKANEDTLYSRLQCEKIKVHFEVSNNHNPIINLDNLFRKLTITHRNLAKRERFTEITTDNAVPSRSMLLVKLLLYTLRYIFLNI